MDSKRDVALRTQLAEISDSSEFEDWVRVSLRPLFPHASFLGIFGRLYGLGSVPTHRVGVDFPLNLAEELKDRGGAIDDPFICEWFGSGKLRYFEVPLEDAKVSGDCWQRTFQKYGVRNVVIFGVLDHKTRRFALFQMCNLCHNDKVHGFKLLASLSAPMAETGWRLFDARATTPSRRIVGHPTGALTATEIQIIEFLSLGLSNKEIARRRGVSSSTIKTQVSRTGAKLGATRRAEIVAVGMSMLSPLPSQSLTSYGDK